MGFQLYIVQDPNHRSHSKYMQLILDTERAPAAGGYMICLQLWLLKQNDADKCR